MYTKTLISVSDPDFDRIAKKIYQSYPNSCITKLEKIEMSPEIVEKFGICHQKLLNSKNSDNSKNSAEDSKNSENKNSENSENSDNSIIELFHGTKLKNIESILKNSFKVSFNVTSAYGKGTYLSDQASLSFNYIDYHDEKNSYNSLKSKGSKGSKGRLGYSYMFLCDVLNDPSFYTTHKNIFVARYDHGCIPSYLITFYKEV